MEGFFSNSKLILSCFVFLELFSILAITNGFPNVAVETTEMPQITTVEVAEGTTVTEMTVDDDIFYGEDDEIEIQEAFPFPGGGGWRPPPNRFWKVKYCPDVKTCSECINSPCTWSLENVGCHKCSVKQRDKKCKTWERNSTFITAENSHRLKCPSFTSEKKIIYVPSGSNKTIKVKAEMGGSKDVLVLANYRCEFKIEGKTIEVKAKLLADDIYCDPVLFSYDSSNSTMSVPLKVFASKNGYYLENPENISIEIFKCAEMGQNCKSCTSTEEKYGCGWCEKTNKCQADGNCEGLRISEESNCK